MRIVKIVLITSIVFMGINNCFAQEISIRGGLNLTQYRQKAGDLLVNRDNTKLNSGFNIGTILELPINNMFSFETGILLNSKGEKLSYENTGPRDYVIQERLYYLDIPVLSKFTVPIKKVKICAAAGFYLGEALYGKNIHEGFLDSVFQKSERDIKWGNEYDRFDYGLKFGIELVYAKFKIGSSYNLGLKNIKNKGSLEIRNRSLELYISHTVFNFNSNKK